MLPMTTALKNGIPSDSSLSIPQELIDYILDFLHDDSPTLRTCSLVSHAFLHCSRYHIYSNVFIVRIEELDEFRDQFAGQMYQCQSLAALLEHSPHVAPLVTRFGIHGNTDFITDIFEDTLLSPIIQALRNLSHIEFICRRYEGLWDNWDDFPVATPRISVAALRSVPLKTFICDSIGFEIQEQFEDLFTAAANPALKHLSLVCDRGADHTFEPYPPIRPPPDGLPALESLSIAGDEISGNIAWLFFHQSLYDVRGVRHLSLQIPNGATSSLLQRLLNEMQGTLESFNLDVGYRWDRSASLDLSQHKTLSSFFIILASRLDSRLLGVCLSPALRTFTVEQVYCDWEYNSRRTVDAWAEFDAHVDGLWQPALRRVHVRLHDNTHGLCERYECHGCDDGMCDCYVCECEQRDRRRHDVPVDHDKWKYQVEESMPSLRGRGILEVEVVKQRSFIHRPFD